MTIRAYDELAPYYRAYAVTRAAYCDAVDRQILEWRPEQATNMLDVGSGDGSRALRLATRLGATRLVLSDPSGPMVKQCRAHAGVEVWRCAAEDLPAGRHLFDVITCLWNVFGHIESRRRRVEALQRMRRLLTPDGMLFVDVHNRHNAAMAGGWTVAGRLLRDGARPGAENGAVSFEWQIGSRRIQSQGYLFSPGEMRALLDVGGFIGTRRAYIDYRTGRRRGRWTGQIVLAASPSRLA